jgi:tetratricopeptide (TPR) repeat protein
VISEASAALLRLSKESSKQMKPPRDSAAGRAAVERQEETYRRIIKAYPRHPFALYGYARFLSNVRKDDRQADQYFQLALKASPFNPEVLATYAHFLERRQRDLDKAHRFYKRAYFVDRRNADVVGAYAIFQHRMLRNYKEAERLFKQVPTSPPAHRTTQHLDSDTELGGRRWSLIRRTSIWWATTPCSCRRRRRI